MMMQGFRGSIGVISTINVIGIESNFLISGLKGEM